MKESMGTGFRAWLERQLTGAGARPVDLDSARRREAVRRSMERQRRAQRELGIRDAVHSI